MATRPEGWAEEALNGKWLTEAALSTSLGPGRASVWQLPPARRTGLLLDSTVRIKSLSWRKAPSLASRLCPFPQAWRILLSCPWSCCLPRQSGLTWDTWRRTEVGRWPVPSIRCCDRKHQGEERVRFRSQVTVHLWGNPSNQNLGQLVLSQPQSRAERNECLCAT